MKSNIFIVIIYFIVSLFTSREVINNYEDINKINSFEFGYTEGYGINTNVRYTMKCDKKCILKVKPYGVDENKATKKELSSKDINSFINILNKYNVLSWDGFNKSDKDVLDGDSFHLYVTYNDYRNISASGYMMYPNNYRDFKNDINDLINELK